MNTQRHHHLPYLPTSSVPIFSAPPTSSPPFILGLARNARAHAFLSSWSGKTCVRVQVYSYMEDFMAAASAKFQGSEFISHKAEARYPYGFVQVHYEYDTTGGFFLLRMLLLQSAVCRCIRVCIRNFEARVAEKDLPTVTPAKGRKSRTRLTHKELWNVSHTESPDEEGD